MIILLNGTSSSGKTSTAKELLKLLDEPYFYLSMDDFLDPSMPLKINMNIEADLAIIDKAILGFTRALKAYAETMDHIIIDHVLQSPYWLHEAANALKGFDVFFVGLTPPLEVLEEREKKRKDRQPGRQHTNHQRYCRQAK